MQKRNITIITGTRAEFGIWTPVLRALATSKKLRPQLLVTGMHLQKQFGYTINDIKKSGIPIAATAEMYKPRDTPADSLARGTQTVGRALEKLKPDLVMLLGDRLEMLAAANAALALQLPIAHLHGGETAPGQWDEQIRHAITKLAHLHFPATKRAAQRIQQMGEDPKRIHVIGAPALDGIMQWQEDTRPAPSRGKRAIVLLHPTSADERVEEKRARMVIEAVRSRPGIPYVTIGPNNDPGCNGILRAYEKMGVKVAMSLPTANFWIHLKAGGVLVGNSSSGIIEAASFGIPVVNIGERQAGRERNANLVDVPWSTGTAGIKWAIQHATTNKEFLARVAQRQNLYGDGHAAERLRKILEAQRFPLPTTKQFHD
ncbi:MAG TPA: UDP-N-acetylglucosamine 2-epimerase [Phycisphaerae bacterium]|nr:UDP-N-acetylglucosamine 2-epimerase [Phycisphaerae bacterium]